MSVNSSQTFIQYTTDGITFSFAVPFYFISQADLLVQTLDSSGNVITYAQVVQYNVTGTPNLFGDYNNGGNVVFVNTPPAGLTLFIGRNTQVTQTVQFQDFNPYTADAFNHVFDKLTLIAQEHVIPGFRGLALGPPTSSATSWNFGDWFKNASPAPGGVWGWLQTQSPSGNPGIWRAFAPISLT